MSLRNGMWHGLRNDIIMRNVIYAEWLKKKFNWKVHLFWHQSICKSSDCFDNVAGSTTMTIKKPRRIPWFSLSISLFRTATKILLVLISQAAWLYLYYVTKVGHWRKDVFNFSAKDVGAINFAGFLTFICREEPRNLEFGQLEFPASLNYVTQKEVQFTLVTKLVDDRVMSMGTNEVTFQWSKFFGLQSISFRFCRGIFSISWLSLTLLS